MAIERPPAPTVGSSDTLRKYRPPSDEIARYHVTQAGRKETLETVARVNSVSVKELIAFNFPGSVVNDAIVPGVVNWYLHHHTEFQCPETPNRLNRAFRGNEKIAIPHRTTVIDFVDPMVIEVQPPALPGVWFGGGYKIGTTFGVVGNETAQIVCVAASGKQGFTATVTGTRLGIGIGASGGPIIVLITSMSSPSQLTGHMSGGWDYSLAVGAKLESLMGGRYARAVRALADFAAKHGKAGAAGLRAGRTLVKYNSQIADIVKMLDMKLDHYEPQMFSFGSPWGGFGAEASFHHSVSEFHVESVVSL
jgi:hypothetical protein